MLKPFESLIFLSFLKFAVLSLFFFFLTVPYDKLSSKIFLLVIQKSKLEADYNYSEDRVVVDGNLVTSRGPGTCFEFAFKLAELLVDNDMYDQLKAQTLALTA